MTPRSSASGIWRDRTLLAFPIMKVFWDILPTCAELAGARAPEGIDGLSLLPTFLGQSSRQEEHESLYWEFKEKQAVRMGDWKGVRIGGEEAELELYNLNSDPGEQHDLSKRHPEIVANIQQIMKSSHDAPRKLTLE